MVLVNIYLTGAISSVKAEDIQNRSITRVEEAPAGQDSWCTTDIHNFATGKLRLPFVSVVFIEWYFRSPLCGRRLLADLSAVDPNNIKSMKS